MSHARQWFVRHRDRELGPLTEFEAKLLLAGLTPDGNPQLRNDAAAPWQPPDQFPALAAPLFDGNEPGRLLFEGAAGPAFIGSPDGRVLALNPAFETITGWPRAAWLGKPFAELLHPGDAAAADWSHPRRWRPGKARPPRPLRVRTAAGAALTLEFRLVPLLVQEHPLAIFGFGNRAGARSELERALRASERLQSSIFSSIQDGITILDLNQNILLANPTMEGWYPHALPLPGKKCHQAYHGRNEPCPGCPVLQTLNTGEPAARTVPRVNPGGKPAGELELLSFPLRDVETGLIVGAIAHLRDITERRKTERALAESNRRLRQATEELKTIDQLKNNLIANLGHELRSPLVAARGYTEMIAEGMSGPVTDQQARQLKTCLQNLDRLLGLISGLLDFSRLETGKIKLQLRDFDLTRLARGTANLLQPHLAAVKVRLAVEFDKLPVPVRGDRTKLEQVLVNLLTNAIKFTPEGGRVTLQIGRSADGKHAEVRVTDTGIGIPAAEQGRIFDLFYQVDSSPERRFGGTGLGLALCRDIVRLHHGELTVASEPGQGATFVFTLPLAQP